MSIHSIMNLPAPVLIPPLKALCVQAVAAIFAEVPELRGLDKATIKRIIDILPLDLPLELAGTHLSDEDYWRRRSAARWRNLEVVGHGKSWKQLYFERNLQDALEKFDAKSDDMHQLKRLMAYSRKFIHALHLRQLPSHIDLAVMFDTLLNSLNSLTLTYGLDNVGMEYDKSLFGIKLLDCRYLARGLETTETLTYLNLSGNSIDDDKLRMLASGLVDNLSITHLDLSHNKIADRGVRTLSKLLDKSLVLSSLDLKDNQIHAEGARALARAVRRSPCLLSLNLRLNRLGNDGCKAMLDALQKNAQLQRLNLSANAGGNDMLPSLSSFLLFNTHLSELDVSGNGLGVEGAPAVLKALQENAAIRAIDVRHCGFIPDDEVAVSDLVRSKNAKRETERMLATKGHAANGRPGGFS